jgi:hypothetical protein
MMPCSIGTGGSAIDVGNLLQNREHGRSGARVQRWGGLTFAAARRDGGAADGAGVSVE